MFDKLEPEFLKKVYQILKVKINYQVGYRYQSFLLTEVKIFFKILLRVSKNPKVFY